MKAHSGPPQMQRAQWESQFMLGNTAQADVDITANLCTLV